MHPGPGVQSSRSHPGTHHHREIRDHPLSMESNRPLQDHSRSHDNPRFPPSHDTRPVHALASVPGTVSPMHSPPLRRASGGSRHESSRQPSHIPHLPPVQHMEASGGYSHSRSYTSPPMHHAHPSLSSVERTRSQSSTRPRVRHSNSQPYLGYSHPHYPEGLPPMQHAMHSPPISERERPRHNLHELVGQHGDHHGHRRHPAPIGHHSPPLHPSETRSSSRVHHPQRIHHDEHHYEHQRDLDREREQEWDRERGRERRDLGRGRELNSTHILAPQMVHNSRQPIDREDYQDHHVPSRMREDQGYYHDASAPGAYSMLSRSGSPGSGSGSGSGIGVGEGPSRPESRTQYYDHDRTRSYRLRPSNHPNEEIDHVHEDGRSASRDRGGGGGGNFPLPEQSRPPMESRKRNHNDMDIDSDNDVGDGASGHVYPSGRIPGDRGSKRYLREHRRSVENQEDNRMGPP